MLRREVALVGFLIALTIGGLAVFLAVLMRPSGAPRAFVLPEALTTQRAPAAPATVQTAPTGLMPSPTWVAQTAARSGISETAIAAYGAATLRIAQEQPSCHLGWTTLAGVGTIESGNGTTGKRRLLASGLATSPISGPALNGAGGYAAIRNGAGGWASALGPMQFIESTWARWGADGNGDGVADVHNIFDAAVAAGRYLCAGGRNLATADGWTAGIYSYNHDVAYVHNVYAAAMAAGR